MSVYTASTVINYSPRKTRLIIDHVRGAVLEKAMILLRSSARPKSKKIYHLLKSAASNINLAESDFGSYIISSIVAEEAQKLYRVVPKARGSAHRIRRRYSRVKVVLQAIANVT